MIPADLEKLYDVETPCEAAWKKLIEDYGLPAFGQRDVEDLPVPRADVQFVLGAHGGHRKIWRAGTYEDAWAFRLTIRITTNAVPAAGEQPHAAWRARIRLLAQYGKDLLGEARLPHHAISGLLSAGSSPEVTSEDDCHVSELTFTGTVSIRSAAWPA